MSNKTSDLLLASPLLYKDILISSWQDIQARIQGATYGAGRSKNAVELVIVSKGIAEQPIRELYLAGQRNFAESYVQEFVEKSKKLLDCKALIWHFIGRIQSNKTRFIAEQASWVHSLDQLKIAERLNAQRPASLPSLNICLQVNLSSEPSKAGIAIDAVFPFAESVSKLQRLNLRGLMCIPEKVLDQNLLATRFADLRRVSELLNGSGFKLDTLSMGMSSDFETAIREGSTCVRIGRAIFNTPVLGSLNKGIKTV